MRKEEREDIIEELAMVLCHVDGQYWNDLTLTEASDYKRKTELVCLKVDRELPQITLALDSGSDRFKNPENDITQQIGECYKQAGYEAVVPLVENGEH